MCKKKRIMLLKQIFGILQIVFYSNDLLYCAHMSYTNLKQDTEQRLNKQKVKNDKLSQFSVTLTSVSIVTTMCG